MCAFIQKSLLLCVSEIDSVSGRKSVRTQYTRYESDTHYP